MRKGPRVSVCIPVYNGAAYISQAIESVLDQEWTDLELVVCDDGSSDETPSICRAYRDARVRYIRFNERGGQAGNFNRCFREARGEFITLLHADDYYLPGLIARRLMQLEAHPDAGFACGAVRTVDSQGMELPASRPWPGARTFAAGGLMEPLLHGCVISTLGLFVRRERWIPFDVELTWGHDWDWELRLAQENGAHYDPDLLAVYRVHDASGTAEVLNAAGNGEQERRILERALARLPTDGRGRATRRSTRRSLALRHMYFGERALLANRPKVARYNMRYAIKADASMAIRPTTWALMLGSIGGARWYAWFRRLRIASRGPQEGASHV